MLVREVLDDLIAEQSALDDVMAAIADDAWGAVTPSPGWTVTDQIGHLTYFDATAALAIADPEGFRTHRAELVTAMADAEAVERETLGRYRAMSPAELLAAWRENRSALAAAAAASPRTRVSNGTDRRWAPSRS